MSISRNRTTATSAWVRQFACTDVKPLIICRGPIRREAMDVFDEMGIDSVGILLSEKDSITYPNALAPELRLIEDPRHIHRVPDYTGVDRQDRARRIQQIVGIARDNGYNAVFAGYGFMAEDEEMVSALEEAGLTFIGPCSHTVRSAGRKDLAKRTALDVGVSVTPGVDNVTILTLLAKAADEPALRQLADEHGLDIPAAGWSGPVEAIAEAVLDASYARGIDIISVEDVAAEMTRQVCAMFSEWPGYRIRLKAIGGGGGKGQRILETPAAFDGDDDARMSAAAAQVEPLLREVLAEVKAGGIGDDKNVLAEINIETVRHQEIQVVGNGDWCITLGGRDCSVQMHEQKLLELSVTREELEDAISRAGERGHAAEVAQLETDLGILAKMEDEAARFGAAVKLDSVSTFESIVDRERHFFMEMNTRVQVEHRVTELCYTVRFTNPDNAEDHFDVDSIVELMVLLARHGSRLPCPSRHVRHPASAEVRLNATNAALRPHAGGTIVSWSPPAPGELRDDQGICLHNPDTDVFMKYHLAGAYDSNIALLLTTGATRKDTFHGMSEILREMRLSGTHLATNLEFHYGLLNWLIGNSVNARPATNFVMPYLTAVGRLKEAATNVDIVFGYDALRDDAVAAAGDDADSAAAIRKIMARKASLLARVINRLFDEPHYLAGWLARMRHLFTLDGERVTWLVNPLRVVADTYHYVNMERDTTQAAYHQIWDHDQALLDEGLAFYDALTARLGIHAWQALSERLDDDDCPAGLTADEWKAARAAHTGHQLGLSILSILPWIGHTTGFYDLCVRDDLSIDIPDRLTDPDVESRALAALNPPPEASADEIIAVSGGMFYAREAPDRPTFVSPGSHFDAGDPLYIVEVMKMFNKVYATFSGTVEEIVIDTDGAIIKKGQLLMRVKPDEEIVIESARDIATRRREHTHRFLSAQRMDAD